MRDPRVPWYARAVAFAVVAYALSPIDLIPDFIPVLGALDDLIIVPLGMLAVRRLIPDEIYEEHLREAEVRAAGGRLRWAGAAMVGVAWLLALVLVALLVLR
jgi:uncharacterized membrane protein YkvA (DUF1232 family)